jgi:hypothetical protein
MRGWNPFGKINMEVGSFLKVSKFNKQYFKKEKDKETNKINKNDNENNTHQ